MKSKTTTSTQMDEKVHRAVVEDRRLRLAQMEHYIVHLRSKKIIGKMLKTVLALSNRLWFITVNQKLSSSRRRRGLEKYETNFEVAAALNIYFEESEIMVCADWI